MSWFRKQKIIQDNKLKKSIRLGQKILSFKNVLQKGDVVLIQKRNSIANGRHGRMEQQ